MILLINHKDIDLSICDKYGNTAIHYAVEYNKVEIIRLLLSKGLDINKKGQGGDTPLHSAVAYDRLELVQLLLEHGADKSIKNIDELTAVDVAIEEGYNNIVVLIRDFHMEDIKEPEFN